MVGGTMIRFQKDLLEPSIELCRNGISLVAGWIFAPQFASSCIFTGLQGIRAHDANHLYSH